VRKHLAPPNHATYWRGHMAKNTIAAPTANGKEGFRCKLTAQEVALIAELYEEVREGRMTAQWMAARFA
jgi:hypothetical protein